MWQVVVENIIQVVVTFFASMGFAFFFNVYRKHILITSIGGTITWAIYKVCQFFLAGYFVPVLIASVFAGFYSEFLAWRTKAPTPIFYIISVIPLVPGRALFYTMSEAVAGNWESCGSYALMTLEYAAAIAVGISLVTAVVQTIKVARYRLRKRITDQGTPEEAPQV